MKGKGFFQEDLLVDDEESTVGGAIRRQNLSWNSCVIRGTIMKGAL